MDPLTYRAAGVDIGAGDEAVRLIARLAASDPSAWPVPAIFRVIQEAGRVEDAEMRRTFNMGLGYLLVVRAGDAARASLLLGQAGERVVDVGEIRAGARSVVYG